MNLVRQKSDKPEQQDRRHILVAEDDVVVQMVVRKILEDAGYTMDLAVDGQEAVTALETRHYDLVLMDCFMPRMNGFEATEAIRDSDSPGINPEIPVIAMTGLTEEVDQRRCLDAGMQSVLSKPFNAQTLIMEIEQYLGGPDDTVSTPDQPKKLKQQIWDDDFLDSVIDEFLEEVPGVIKDLQQAVDKGDASKLGNIAHRFRGSSDILNASGLSARSRVLEQAVKAGEMELAVTHATELILELLKLTSILAE
jgi:CheY-like chemotaxis protein